MRVAAYDMYAQSYHESGENWAKIKTEYPDIKVKSFPPEVIAALRKANEELLAEAAGDDPLAKEIIDSQAAYLEKVRAWTDISDRAYLDSLDQ